MFWRGFVKGWCVMDGATVSQWLAEKERWKPVVRTLTKIQMNVE